MRPAPVRVEHQAIVTPELSVVVPVMNEVENAVPLLNEICAALRGKIAFEVLFVDDASKDATVQSLLDARKQAPELRVLRHEKNSGQSRAVRTGVMAAKGRLVVTLDGDGQNDPADIPKLLAAWTAASEGARPLGVVAGQRVKRQDSAIKRLSSRIANNVRQWLLDDRTRDTGCGLKLFSREAFLALPYFDHLHRYMPALMLREGYRIAHVDVHHRPRSHGVSKYGTLDRLLVSFSDLMGVRWLKRRARNPQRIDEL
jgi:dolichol-phosphate mannosyltransferase